MIIREAKISDIAEIRKLGANVYEFSTTEEVVTFWPEHILRNCVESKTDWLLVAEKDSEIIGFIICNNSRVFKKAVIENVFVSPLHRKKGVGKKLLESLLAKIQLTDCEYVAVATGDNNNTAISFYVKNGFNRGGNFAWMDKVLSEKFSKL
ncbi:MAG: GNAT family N-acetyltransferase [bacterium]|nr:GNAT family N-acetyltransferase [bacterium]